MASRTIISIYDKEGKNTKTTIDLPDVFKAPIRPDIVQFVHDNMAKNHRQPYAVFKRAGHEHSAESWGTGRAVSRIPRIAGGGTGRSGQAAFGNMVRGGHMYNPTKTWRRWHRHINVNQKRYAVCSAIAASSVAALVMARGHRIEKVPEIPLVIENSMESIVKTKDAVKLLKAVGAYDDVQKVIDSKHIRCGKGKYRNRRHVMKRGPLVVYSHDNGVVKAFRNIAGLELNQVTRMNLLDLAPGGHLGRFIIWTADAVNELNNVYGTFTTESKLKNGYILPSTMMKVPDVARIINSDEIQSKLRPIRHVVSHLPKRNLLTNRRALNQLNPYAETARKIQQKLAQQHKKRSEKVKRNRAERKNKNYYKEMIAEADFNTLPEGEKRETFAEIIDKMTHSNL